MLVRHLELFANWIGRISIVHRFTQGKYSGPLHHVMSQLYPRTIEIEVLPGITQKITTDKYDSLALRLREYEPDIRQLMREIVYKGDVVIDGGAHIGFHTLLLAALVGPKGTVYAFEPSERNFTTLYENITENEWNCVKPYWVAIGDQRGIQKLSISETNSGQHSLVREQNSGKFERVPVVRLDQVIPFTQIRLVKLDLEGNELPTLRGLGKLINNTEHIIFEYNPERVDKEIFDFLREKGFEIEQINKTNYHATGCKNNL